MSFDHILVIGFGGPTKPEEVEPFLEEVTRGLNIPEARLQEVRHHYEAVGGRSRYNEHIFALATKLEERLRARGVTKPVFVGMRNWHPFLNDVMRDIQQRSLKRGIGVILAPHRSYASFERYLQNIENAKVHASAQDIQYDYLPPWHDHPLFIEAQADQVRKTLQVIPAEDRRAVHLLFSAHSLPTVMAQQCRYVQEVEMSSHQIARLLEHEPWSVAYQSRSGNPREPWLEPDVQSVIRELKRRRGGQRHVVVVPIGFLCDNVEVLFDLDIEARQEAERVGLGFSRAPTVQDHPQLLEMFAELIQEPIHAH